MYGSLVGSCMFQIFISFLCFTNKIKYNNTFHVHLGQLINFQFKNLGPNISKWGELGYEVTGLFGPKAAHQY